MVIRTWPSRKCVVLLSLVLVLTALPPASAQQPLAINSGVALSFDALTVTPTTASVPVASTARPAIKPNSARPTHKPNTTRPIPAPVAGSVFPAPTTRRPAATAPATVAPAPTIKRPEATSTTALPTAAATHADSGSSFSEATADVSGNSTQPTVMPSPAPTPAPIVTTAAPAKSHDCDEATTSLVTKFYENNDVLEGDCAAVNNYYRYPFDGVPSRAQLLNMSKSASCTVLMQALLQLVSSECDFKRIPLRSTAEAILQLAKDMKKKGENVVLPSEDAITKAIEARRQDLLNSTGGSKADAGSVTESASLQSSRSKAASTTASSASGSSWAISENITSVDDDGKHILMDTDLLVVGTWSDNPDNFAVSTALSPASVGADADPESSLKLVDTKTVAPTPTPSATTSTSGSLQLAAVSVQAALVLAWVFVQ